MDIREEFEKLPVIESKLEHLFFEDGFYYAKYDDADQDEYFVNGAWYAFQEQQNKIDAIKSKISDIYDACDENKTIGHLLDEIRELLKWP